jgi:DNA helicase II / ATP-dependent DNA helicase PcrA
MTRFDEVVTHAGQCWCEFRQEFSSLGIIPVPIQDIVDLLYGIRIVPEALAPEFSGNYDGEHLLIEVNQTDPPESQRFTLAHELGHHILHREVMEKIFQDYRLELAENLHLHPVIAGDQRERSKLINKRARDTDLARLKREAEANLFAVELLVPLEILIPLVQQHLTPDQLAERFKVSHAVMRYRLYIYYLAEDPAKDECFKQSNRSSLFYQQFILPREDPENT